MKRKLIGLMCVLAVTTSFIACGGEKKEDSKAKSEVTEESKENDKDKDNESDEEKSKDEESDKKDDEDKEEDKETASSSDNPLATFGYEIDIPSSWTKLPEEFVDAMGGNSVEAEVIGLWGADILTGATFGIMSEKIDTKLDLDAYVKIMEAMLKQTDENATAKVEKFGDVEVAYFTMSADEAGKTLNMRQAIFSTDSEMILLMLSEEDGKKSKVDEFEKVLNSLKEI